MLARVGKGSRVLLRTEVEVIVVQVVEGIGNVRVMVVAAARIHAEKRAQRAQQGKNKQVLHTRTV